MKRWAGQYVHCANCGTVRFRHQARGYCTRCYGLILARQQIQGWDYAKPQTLKGYPGDLAFWDPKIFLRVRRELLSRIDERLAWFKAREKQLARPARGTDIERQLHSIATQLGIKKSDLPRGLRPALDRSFNAKQKKILFELLNEIEEKIPWTLKAWGEIFFA